MPRRAILLLVLTLFPHLAHAGRQPRVDLSHFQSPTYTVQGHAFLRHNGDRYNNRPLYCNQLPAVVLAGDKPYALLAHNKTILSNLMFAYGPRDHLTWLHLAKDITSAYRPDRMNWTLTDPAWPGTTLHLEILPTAHGPGLVAHLHLDHPQPNATLLLATGAAQDRRHSTLYDWDMLSANTISPTRGFTPADCANNVATIDSPTTWTLKPTEKSSSLTTAQSSAPLDLKLSDASAAQNPSALLTTEPKSQPLLIATLKGPPQDLYIALNATTPDQPAPTTSPQDQFHAAQSRADAIENRVVIDTPDPWLNAAASAASAALDGVYRNHIYTHAGMRWSVPLLGWRSLYGPSAYAWHDRILAEAQTCLPKQITSSDKTQAHADPKTLLSSQAPDSRLFGAGRVDAHQPYHYDMQSQFFDQLAHDWQSTANPDLEKILYPALNLHCQYLKDCFDPDGDGAYESYCNTWPTDDQWYNGGATAEETAYAYTAESTAAQLARRAGKEEDAKSHETTANHIRDAFFKQLWNPQLGHPGAYREQYGLKRLHNSPWLYSIFCPIDAGLLNSEQSAQSLYYTEYALERDDTPWGGQQCWPSNWVPSVWSVRELWPGDTYALALAYFQTGLPDEAYTLLRGTFPQYLLFGPTPADLGHPAGATDFSDCVSPFARTIVQGLFGYQPHYPDGSVTIAPQLPTNWDHASIQTRDFSLHYTRKDTHTTCDITLTHPAALTLQLPVNTTAVQTVTNNGQPINYTLTPAFHRTLVTIPLPQTTTAQIKLTTADTLPITTPTRLTANPNDPLLLPPPIPAQPNRPHATRARDPFPYLALHDPQSALTNTKIENGTITATIANAPGDHLLFALAQTGQTQQWRLIKLHTTDTTPTPVVTIPDNAHFTPIDLSRQFNADVTQIYQQKYLSPRPNTVSLRLATDGYATWQMVLQKHYHPPTIDLANLPTLLDKNNLLITPLHIPFLPPSTRKNNIAFTSGWDTYPKQIDFPIHQTGHAIAFLLAGTTNPMEVRIPNAQLRLTYADNTTETIDLIPPMNFWTLCPLDGIDYDYTRDAFALPKTPPPTLQLGQNCRATLLSHPLRPHTELKSVTLETLSNQVTIGLMAITVISDK